MMTEAYRRWEESEGRRQRRRAEACEPSVWSSLLAGAALGALCGFTAGVTLGLMIGAGL